MPARAAPPAGIDPIATVREDEGLTLVLSRQEEADAAGLSSEAPQVLAGPS